MLTRFTAHNLKAFADVSTALAPLTVVVGVNGIGKSTLLDGLHWVLELTQAPDAEPMEPLGRAAALFVEHRAMTDVLRRPDAGSMTLEVEFGDDDRFTAMLGADEKRRLAAVSLSRGEEQTLTYPVHGLSEEMRAVLGDPEKSFFDDPTLKSLGSVARLQLSAREIARDSKAATGVPVVRDDGYGLSTMLQYLAGERDGRLDAIESALRQIVPDFRRVKTPPTEIEEWTTEILRIDGEAISRRVQHKAAGYSLQLEFDGPGLISAQHASEGTLLALALLTRLHADPPRLVLIDDGDRALHPAAQQMLIDLIRRCLDAQPGLQVIMTTHSPDLVDNCSADEVRVLGLGQDGRVQIASLHAHPEAAKWLKLMRVGEFWSTVGEDWMAEERT